ncbi:MAG TPA: HAD family hydrolase [Conexibacter sp.]|jgi:putative hydrolase of the HAD superfamily|nr:HAD family hydrolase [Conexibacter sp.]
MHAVLFDLDGTLMDHDAAREAAIAAHLTDAALAGEWRRLEAIHYNEYAAGRCTFQEQRRRRVRGIHVAMGRPEPADDACDAWFAAYLEHYRAGWAAYDDVLPALAALAQALPDAALGVVTNGEGEPQRAKLAAIGLAERFPVVVASAEVGIAKPDPAIFMLACERLGVEPPAAAHVGDRLDLDAHGAASAGLRGIWLDRPAAAAAGSAADRLATANGLPPAAGVATIATLHELPAVLAAMSR